MTFLGEAPSLGSDVFLNAGRDVEDGLVVTVDYIYKDGFATWPDLYDLSLNIVGAPDIYYLQFTLINNDSEYSVSASNTSIAGALEIPSTYNGKPVTTVANLGFKDCEFITSIVLRIGFTAIGDNAFHNCTSLTSITLPDSITSIGGWAFRYCTALTSIILPDSITSIGNSTFSRCSALTSITLPNSITSIGYYAFYGCSSLTSITLPDSLTSIGDYAFNNCYMLASMTFLGAAPTVEESTAFENAGRDVDDGLVVNIYKAHEAGFATWPGLYDVSLNVLDAVEPPVVVSSFTTEASYDPNHNSFSIISRNEASGATVSLQHTESLHETWATLESSDYTETEDSDAGTVTRTVTLDPETMTQGYYRLTSETSE